MIGLVVVEGPVRYRKIGLDIAPFAIQRIRLDLQSFYAFNYGSTLAIYLSVFCCFCSDFVQYAGKPFNTEGTAIHHKLK
jgi:hypothetical protein